MLSIAYPSYQGEDLATRKAIASWFLKHRHELTRTQLTTLVVVLEAASDLGSATAQALAAMVAGELRSRRLAGIR
jgi:hypothetical protein